MPQNRRVFIQLVGRGTLFLVSYPILSSPLLYAAVDATPENTEGPFYKPDAPLRSNLIEKNDSGDRLIVAGQIINTEAIPLQKALLEIWHTDPAGRYDLDGFRYRAQIPVNQSGEYRFTTFLPGSYSSRPKHIHYKIGAPNHEELTTQLYFETDSFFEGAPDRTIDKDPIVQYRELIRPVKALKEGASVYFRICLKRA